MQTVYQLAILCKWQPQSNKLQEHEASILDFEIEIIDEPYCKARQLNSIVDNFAGVRVDKLFVISSKLQDKTHSTRLARRKAEKYITQSSSNAIQSTNSYLLRQKVFGHKEADEISNEYRSHTGAILKALLPIEVKVSSSRVYSKKILILDSLNCRFMGH